MNASPTCSISQRNTPAAGLLLRTALHDPHPGARLRAAVALYEMDGRIDLILPLLLKALRTPHALVRWLAATCLGQLGAPARVARPQLWDALNAEGESPQVRASIRRALERIGAGPESEGKTD